MNHVPGLTDFMRLAFLIIFGGWALRAVLCWLLRTREIERRVHELEAVVRAIGGHLDVPLPKPVARMSLRARAMACFARLRA
jgi:hypothetical protein